MNYISRRPHLHQSCQRRTVSRVAMVQIGCGNVRAGRIFSWLTLGPLETTEHYLNDTVCLSIAADHIHPLSPQWITLHVTKQILTNLQQLNEVLKMSK